MFIMIKYKLKSRKVISINYSFFVSLPPDWLFHHKIIKGDSLNISIGKKGELILKKLNSLYK